MTEKIINLFKRMKVGANYKKLMVQAYMEKTNDLYHLAPGAKIKHNAQTTFHTSR